MLGLPLHSQAKVEADSGDTCGIFSASPEPVSGPEVACTVLAMRTSWPAHDLLKFETE